MQQKTLNTFWKIHGNEDVCTTGGGDLIKGLSCRKHRVPCYNWLIKDQSLWVLDSWTCFYNLLTYTWTAIKINKAPVLFLQSWAVEFDKTSSCSACFYVFSCCYFPWKFHASDCKGAVQVTWVEIALALWTAMNLFCHSVSSHAMTLLVQNACNTLDQDWILPVEKAVHHCSRCFCF